VTPSRTPSNSPSNTPSNTPTRTPTPSISPVAGGVVSNGIILYLDPGNSTSYPGTGTVWSDLSTFNHSGSLVNAPVHSPTSYGGIFTFNGTDEYVNLNAYTDMNTPSGSYQIWIKDSAPSDGLNHQIFSRTNTNAGTFNLLKRNTNVYGANFRRSADPAAQVNIDGSTATSNWINLTLTYDGTDLKLYENATLITTSTNAGTIDTSNYTATNLARNTTAAAYFPGDMGVVLAYNRALTAAEVTTNYNAFAARYVEPSPTPSITPTITPTRTISPTITRTATPSISLSPSITPSITATITPSITRTATPSITPSITRTVTPSTSGAGGVSLTPSLSPTTLQTQTFTTTGAQSFVVPANVYSIYALLVGAGGGGAGGDSAGGGSTGGGGGALAYGTIPVAPGETLTFTVGAGGTAGTSGNDGGNGGFSRIARGATTLINAGGGEGGANDDTGTVAGGTRTYGATVTNTGGGNGGTSGATTDTGGGGGGAGGYTGNGGNGGTSGAGTNGAGGGGGGGGATNSGQGYGGGGVGIPTAGTSGTGGALNAVGTGGSGGANGTRPAGGLYGGGGGACDDDTNSAGGAGAQGVIYIEYQQFLGTPTPTVSISQTPSVTRSISVTPSVTRTVTPTRTPSRSVGAPTSITFIGSAQSTTGTMTLPTGLQQNDLVIVATYRDDNTANLPTGYTAGQNGTSNNVNYRWSYKRMGATPDTTVTGLSTSAAIHIAIVFRNVNTTTALDVASPTRTTNTAGMPNPPSITTVTNNAMVVVIGYLDDDVITATAPTNFTLARTANYGSAGAGGTIMAAYRTKSPAGAEDAGTFGGGGTDSWVATTLALRLV
jgi:hypothetical protein